jgi:hypothetical protein
LVVLRATLVGEKVQVSPVEGDTPTVRLTVPVKPSRPVAVIVEVPADPARTVTLVGDAARAKSWTL